MAITPNLYPDPNASFSERVAHPLLASGGQLMPDRLYTSAEVAVILSVAPSTLRRWRAEGSGPKVTQLVQGGRPLYRGRDVAAALDAAAA